MKRWSLRLHLRIGYDPARRWPLSVSLERTFMLGEGLGLRKWGRL